MNSHFVANVIWQLGEDGPEFLTIEYDSGQGVQIKFPGGTNSDHPGETKEETLHRETRDETGLVIPGKTELIWSPEPRNGHTKYAFLTPFSECAGKVRTEPMTDGTDRLSPPFWRTYEELHGTIFRTHAPMLEEANRRLAGL